MKINLKFFDNGFFWKEIKSSISQTKVVERTLDIEDALVDEVLASLRIRLHYEIADQLLKNDAFMQKLVEAATSNLQLNEIVKSAMAENTRETIKRMAGFR